MAARANSLSENAGRREIVDLRRISAGGLDPVLEDEIREWRAELDWDFTPTAELVRQYADTHSLGGAALMLDGEVAGYGYAVVEEPRGIIGDIYVRPHRREPECEAELFWALQEALAATPRVNRMESQLMLAGPAVAALIQEGALTRGESVRLFGRLLMSRAGASPVPPENPAVRSRFRLEPWDSRLLHFAGAIIAGAYKGETDSMINAQYRSPAGARLFLSNIVEFPGCGRFHAGASFMAFDSRTGAAAGMVLSSFVAENSGHISQLCVMPEARNAGLGGELLRASTEALCRHRARSVSLTVTASNHGAISIYEKFGFRDIRTFHAYVWEA